MKTSPSPQDSTLEPQPKRQRTEDRRSLMEVEASFISPETATLSFVKRLVEISSEHEGPLNADSFILQLMKAARSLPKKEERKELKSFLNQLDPRSLKKLNKEPTSITTEVQNSVVGAVVSSASKEYARPLLVQGASSAAGFMVAGPAGAVIAPIVLKPVVDAVLETGEKITKEVLKIAEKHTAKKIMEGINAGSAKLKDAASSAYEGISTKFIAKKPAPALILSKKLEEKPKRLIEVISSTSTPEKEEKDSASSSPRLV